MKRAGGAQRQRVYGSSATYNLLGRRPILQLPAVVRQPAGNLLAILRWDQTNFLTGSAIAGVGAATAFALNQFADNSTYIALFDQYRIRRVRVRMEPVGQTVNGSSTLVSGGLVTCVDLDDANVPSSSTTVLAHQGAISSTGQCGHTHEWTPYIARAVYSGSTSVFEETALAPWLNTSSGGGGSGVPHYGFKAYAKQSLAGAPEWSLSVEALIEFREAGI